MRPRITARRVAVLVAGVAAVAIAVPLSSGSSHREAPNIMLDPTGDNTDTYAFTADDEPNSLTVVANWIPGEVPANGPNFFRFDDNAKYYINIDNTGDGVPEIRYKYKFSTNIANPNSFLYAGPGTEDFSDPGLNISQTYKLIKEQVPSKGNVAKRTTIGRNLPVAPPNIGPKTFPSYQKFTNQATVTLGNGTRTFAGQRDDPFFVDLGATFDAINIREGTGNEGEGKDDFSGYSIESTVLQIPENEITNDGKSVSGPDADNAVVGVWASTERRKLEFSSRDYNVSTNRKIGRGKKQVKNRYVQVSRLGNPLVNEVIIPLGSKDKFNRTRPDRDADLYASFVLKPELAAVLNALFDVNAPENNRDDIVQAVLQGIPGLNEHSGKDGGTPVDTLKINLGVPPSSSPSRFGVIGGDNAGYPNGRRLIDDVVDIDLQVVAGFLVDNEVPLGDGVDQNDKPFLSKFPYLAAPDSGFESNPSQRIEPAHEPVPAGGN
ncbi:MAG: DUF4331 domain-containing protein [Solirubrobacterales bacterium]